VTYLPSSPRSRACLCRADISLSAQPSTFRDVGHSTARVVGVGEQVLSIVLVRVERPLVYSFSFFFS